jgi:hypothetical protein
MANRCAHCNFDNEDGVRFCFNCAGSLDGSEVGTTRTSPSAAEPKRGISRSPLVVVCVLITLGGIVGGAFAEWGSHNSVRTSPAAPPNSPSLSSTSPAPGSTPSIAISAKAEGGTTPRSVVLGLSPDEVLTEFQGYLAAGSTGNFERAWGYLTDEFREQCVSVHVIHRGAVQVIPQLVPLSF